MCIAMKPPINILATLLGSLLLVSCGDSVQVSSEQRLFEGDEWPGFSYSFNDIPEFSNAITTRLATVTPEGVCITSGRNLDQARLNFSQSCPTGRLGCEFAADQFICFSAPGAVSSNVVESPTPAVAPPEDTTAAINPAIAAPEPIVSAEAPAVTFTPSSSTLIDAASGNYAEANQKAGYRLVFSDEFDSGEVNPTRWNTQLRWDGEFNGSWFEYRIVNGEKQFYVNRLSPDGEHQNVLVPVYNPFSFDGTRLAIRAAVNPFLENIAPTGPTEIGRNINFGLLQPLLKRQPFLSGVLSSHDKFSRKYGYFEARIRIPSHPGTFPAFWLYHQRDRSQGTRRTEIDIMENLGHAPQYVYNSFHYFDNVTLNNPGNSNFIRPEPNGQIQGDNFSNDYHVYAVDWSPGQIIWFIDGQEVSRLNNPNVDYEEMYIILNLAIGGNWVNFPASAGGLGRADDQRYPTADEQRAEVFGNPQLEIDYVRVYERL